MANAWNRIRYTLYAPFYDPAIAVFDRARQRSIALLDAQPGESVLIVGAGTGEDLRHLPPHARITAVDITPAMVAQIASKAAPGQQVTALVMDGQALTFPDAHFDAVVLHLIVAVIPDPVACLREAARVLKPGGRIVVFDKFLDDDAEPSLARRLFNGLMVVAATNINRRLLPLAQTASLAVVHQEPAARLSFVKFKIALLRHAST